MTLIETMESGNSSKDGEKATGVLIEKCGPKIGKIYELRGSEVTIGRVAGVDIQIKSRSVSRMHCKLIYSSGQWSVIDLGSQNGTYVNDKPAQSCVSVPLKLHDILYLGPPLTETESFYYHDYRPREVNVVAHSSTSFSHDIQTRSKNKKENVSVEAFPSDSVSSNVSQKNKKPDKKNNYNSKPRKRIRIVGPAAVDSCSDDQRNGEFSKNECECSSSDKDLMDISASSVESLKTRISKTSSAKRKKRNNACSLNKDSESEKSLDTDKTLKNESFNSGKNLPASVKCVLDEVFLEDDNSQSLLTSEGDLLIGSDPIPFSQPIASPPVNQLRDPNSDSEDDLEPIISRRSTELILKSQIQLLQEKVQKLEETQSDLKKEVAQKAKLLKEFQAKKMKQDQDIQELKRTVKEEVCSEIMKRVDEELLCNICTEILIKATVLECSHTFCEQCIYEWKKKKKQCPICRTAIKSESKVLVLDHFVDKILDFVNPTAKEKRKEIADKREELKSVSNANSRGNGSRRRGRRRRISRGTNASVNSADPHDHSNDISPEEIRVISAEEIGIILGSPNPSTVGSVVDDFSNILFDHYNLITQSSSVGGYGHYPGYGRCFNCGRTGHWANGCPENI